MDVDKVQHGMSSRGEFRVTPETLTDTWTNITTISYDESNKQEMVVVLNVGI